MIVRSARLREIASDCREPCQKKNVVALHEAAARDGYAPLLEISSQSEEKLGRHLSAFHLKVRESALDEIKLEAALQGSKVFERGGPYTDFMLQRGRRPSEIRAFRNPVVSRDFGVH
jgi:hypothetical protein